MEKEQVVRNFFIIVLVLLLVGCGTSEELPESGGEPVKRDMEPSLQSTELLPNEELLYTLDETIGGEELFASPDGKRWALIQGNKVIVDGTMVGQYSYPTEFLFSSDSTKYAFFIVENEIKKVVYNGKVLDSEAKSFSSRQFTDDGQLVYETATAWDPVKGSKEAVVIEGIKQKEYKRIGDLLVGQGLVYTVSDESGDHFIVVEGKEYRPNQGELQRHLTMTPEGRVAWIVYNREINGYYPGQFVVIDGKEDTKYYSDITSIRSTPDGKFVYIAKVEPIDSSQDIKWFVVTEGKEEELDFPTEVSWFTKNTIDNAGAKVSSLFFDSGGGWRGYSLNNGDDDKILVVDGKVIKGGKYVTSQIYSFHDVIIDGQNIYAILQERREDFGFENYYLIKNDELVGKYSLIEGLEVKNNQIAYIASPEEKEALETPLSGEVLDRMVFINGRQESYPHVEELTITPQNKVVYKIGPSLVRDLDTLVVDGQKGRTYEKLSNYIILPDGKIVHYALLDNKILRVVRED